jgi:hypothetical protein
MTPTIDPCRGFSVITSVVDTVDTGVNDTGEQLLPVTMAPVINLSPVTTTPVNNYRQ